MFRQDKFNEFNNAENKGINKEMVRTNLLKIQEQLDKMNKNKEKYFNAPELVLKYIQNIYNAYPNLNAVNEIVNFDEFLSQLTFINCAFVFEGHAAAFLAALKKNTTITEYNFQNGEEIKNYLTPYFAEYLKETTSLVKLDVSPSGFVRREDRIKTKNLNYLIQGLLENKTLEEIDFSRNPIKDKGLIKIINALEKNPHCKIKKLNFYQCEITKKSETALITFIKKTKSLEVLNLNENDFSDNSLIEINRQLSLNQKNNAKPKNYHLTLHQPNEMPQNEISDLSCEFVQITLDSKKQDTSLAEPFKFKI